MIDSSRSAGEGTAAVTMVRSEVKLATFRVGTSLYAIDILRIKEIVRPVKVTEVPNAPSFIEGVIDLRGEVIPVIDLRKRFSVAEIVDGRTTRMVVSLAFRRHFALVVDEVLEVGNYGREDVQPAPTYFQGDAADIFFGVAHRADDLLMILDLERLLSLSHITDFTLPSGGLDQALTPPLS